MWEHQGSAAGSGDASWNQTDASLMHRRTVGSSRQASQRIKAREWCLRLVCLKLKSRHDLYMQRAKSRIDPTINAVARYGSLLLRRPYP